MKEAVSKMEAASYFYEIEQNPTLFFRLPSFVFHLYSLLFTHLLLY